MNNRQVKELLDHIHSVAVFNARTLNFRENYRETGLHDYIRTQTGNNLNDVVCDQIISNIYHNYKPGSYSLTGPGLSPESWEDWFRRFAGLPVMTYEEFVKGSENG